MLAAADMGILLHRPPADGRRKTAMESPRHVEARRGDTASGARPPQSQCAFNFCQPSGSSLQLVGDLVDAGLDADLVFFAARSTRSTGRADRLIADLDRQRALGRD